MSTGPRKAFALYLPRERRCLSLELRDAAVAERLAARGLSPAQAGLSVNLLAELVFRDALGLDPDRLEGHLDFAKSVDDALADLEAGDYALAAFLGATSMAEMQAVAERGETMPQKSTYFLPEAAVRVSSSTRCHSGGRGRRRACRGWGVGIGGGKAPTPQAHTPPPARRLHHTPSETLVNPGLARPPDTARRVNAPTPWAKTTSGVNRAGRRVGSFPHLIPPAAFRSAGTRCRPLFVTPLGGAPPTAFAQPPHALTTAFRIAARAFPTASDSASPCADHGASKAGDVCRTPAAGGVHGEPPYRQRDRAAAGSGDAEKPAALRKAIGGAVWEGAHTAPPTAALRTMRSHVRKSDGAVRPISAPPAARAHGPKPGSRAASGGRRRAERRGVAGGRLSAPADAIRLRKPADAIRLRKPADAIRLREAADPSPSKPADAIRLHRPAAAAPTPSRERSEG